MRFLFFYILIFLTTNVLGQTIIQGRVYDIGNKALANVPVLINKINTTNTLAYTLTDKDGFFTITIISDEKEYEVVVNFLGFEPIKTTLVNQSQTKDFVLKTQALTLKEIVVKKASITQQNDTINYNVSSFAKVQDRSISDVLKRLPGIEVLADGKILYQGKPINKYYIDGLDLLEGNYSLANENLSHGAVAQVQVLENHQPIKALDDIKFSNKTAINIKLRKAVTVTSQAILGLGASPLLWHVNLTPMVFTKKRQMIMSYQSNNFGSNVSTQLKKFTIDDVLNQLENNSEKKDLLSIVQLQPPSFSESRWLDNNINLFSGNYLQKLKKEYELRINFSYLNDVQKQMGSTTTNFITPAGIINLFEAKNNTLFYNSIQTNLTIQRNTKSHYFKNLIEIQGFWDSQSSILFQNNQLSNQHLSNEFFKLSNTLKSIFSYKKQVLNLNSFMSLQTTPQILDVTPGQFQDLLNNSLVISRVEQNINLQTFVSNHSVSFLKVFKGISFEPRVGFVTENQKFKSSINVNNNDALQGEFSNNLDWDRLLSYAKMQIQYKKNKFRFDLTTPINVYNYKISDVFLRKQENLSQTTFEPQFMASFDANSAYKISTSMGISNQFATINQLHYAYILKNYRNLSKIDAPLQMSTIQNYSVDLSYRNPVKLFFWNINLAQTLSNTNLLYSSLVSQNGSTTFVALPIQNDRVDDNIAGKASKYFSSVKTNLTVNSTFSIQNFTQLINNQIAPITNRTFSAGIKIQKETKWFDFEYKGDLTVLTNKTGQQQNNPNTIENHSVNINFKKNQNHLLVLKSDYISNKLLSETATSIFVDVLYRFTFQKNKIDLEFHLTNLLNNKNFRTVNIDDFSFIETNFALRPRQILLKTRFTL